MINIVSSKNVAVEQIKAQYPENSPFHPSKQYPEYTGPIGIEENSIYEGIRQLFIDLEFDKENIGTSKWNPLGDIVHPGQQILIKPNIVLHENYKGFSVDSVITHGSVIRAVTDYVIKALMGSGKIIIGDAPLQQCDFAKANQLSKLVDVVDYYKKNNIPIELIDFRLITSEKSKTGLLSRRAGDPAGFSYIDLSETSALESSGDFKKFRVTNYNPEFMLKHHDHFKHEYIIANSVLMSDVVISIPKLKTHRKAGITGATKNLIGINGHKDCLPHHKTGSKGEGGDEYLTANIFKKVVTKIQEFEDIQKSAFLRFLIKVPKKILHTIISKIAKDKYFEGSWWGNDTIWRTLIDLARILFFWDIKTGKIENEQQRAFFTIVDAVIAGEGEGPLAPTPKYAGLLIGGFNPVAVDIVGARLMGFDYNKIPALANSFKAFANFIANDISVISTDLKFKGQIIKNTEDSFF